jgi:hypothetical protein
MTIEIIKLHNKIIEKLVNEEKRFNKIIRLDPFDGLLYEERIANIRKINEISIFGRVGDHLV